MTRSDSFRGSPRRNAATALGGLALLGLLRGVSWPPNLVEAVYAERAGPLIVRGLTSVSGLVPFSLAEPVVVLGVVWWIGPMAFAVRDVLRGRRSVREVSLHHGLRSVALLVVVTVIFYLTWGLNYARANLVTRQGWGEYAAPLDDERQSAAELAGLTEALVEAANLGYRDATGSTDLGRPSSPASGITAVDLSLDLGYRHMAQVLSLSESFVASRGRAKPAVSSRVMNHLGIVGIHFPWTGEANYNYAVPAFQLPHAIAHEKAHQRGVASEDEANFIGYLASALSDDPYARYSGFLFAQRQLLGELWQVDEARAAELLARRHPGVQRDVDAGRAFWQQYEGRPREVQRDLNDAYLEFHGVEGGVESYSRSVQLLVIFSRANDGSPIPAAGPLRH